MVNERKITLFGKEFKIRLDVVLQVDNQDVVDLQLIRLLMLIDKLGSISGAARVLSMPYSRAWDKIAKAERILGVKLVESKRGGASGGGTSLTNEARELVRVYKEILTKLNLKLEEPLLKVRIPDLTYIGSNDPVVEIIAGLLRDQGLDVHISWTGSSLGIAALVLGECDISGIHILDPETGQYNVPILKRQWRGRDLVLVRGYLREIGFATRGKYTLEEVLDGIIRGELTIVNRQPGAGARVLLEHLIKQECKRRGLDFDLVVSRIRGYENVVDTHLEVAQTVAAGRADVGVCIRWAAEQYGLNFIPVTWENFDFVTTPHKLNMDSVTKFIQVLKNEEFRRRIERLPGYRVPEDSGSTVLVLQAR